ncbi:MAG: NifU family protein [Micavibrio aeruginosavorus]|uniref:NifU family protein n=1 Tax=Micavibrio aeruginosavorus TaxID=349221 RepID=A0A2W5MWE3_9BACT|nr:MAG: NifU family protein [Micavibrio aeruginosavorus]
MFIQTEATPNPATVKFIPGVPVMTSGVAEFISTDAAAKSPLAERIFAVNGVQSVFFGSDFVSVTKGDSTDWPQIKGPILSAVMQHFSMGEPLFREEGAIAAASDDLLDEISKQIKELIDKRVRPAVAMDGGDIVFEKFEKGVVFLKMRGACSGCPSSTVTLKSGVENMLRHYVPEVLEVRQSVE